MIELHKLSAPCKLKIMIVVEINYYARTIRQEVKSYALALLDQLE